MKRKSLLIMLLAALFMPLALHAQQSLPYSYGFEDQDLSIDGWTTQNTVTTYTHIYSASTFELEANEGLYVFGFPYSETNGAYLVSPLLSGTNNGLDLSFFYRDYDDSWGDEQFQVGYTTSETVTDASAFTFGDVITASMSWQEYSNSFPAGTKRIAIKYIYNDTYYLLLDDFSFTAPGACARPSNLAVENVAAA